MSRKWGRAMRKAGGIIAFTPCLMLILTGPATAEINAPARVVKVYDGDTLTAEAQIWPGITWRGSVRVRGVDTPEIRGKCAEEKERAITARDFVRDLLIGKAAMLMNVAQGKYAGRVVASVRLEDETDLADVLIAAGLGRPYEGGKREGWC